MPGNTSHFIICYIVSNTLGRSGKDAYILSHHLLIALSYTLQHYFTGAIKTCGCFAGRTRSGWDWIIPGVMDSGTLTGIGVCSCIVLISGSNKEETEDEGLNGG
jgi:hypothetical protein